MRERKKSEEAHVPHDRMPISLLHLFLSSSSFFFALSLVLPPQKSTAFEILLPVLFMAIMVLVRHLTEKNAKQEVSQEYAVFTKAGYSLTLCRRKYRRPPLSLSLVPVQHCQRLVRLVGYLPSSSPPLTLESTASLAQTTIHISFSHGLSPSRWPMSFFLHLWCLVPSGPLCATVTDVLDYVLPPALFASLSRSVCTRFLVPTCRRGAHLPREEQGSLPEGVGRPHTYCR